MAKSKPKSFDRVIRLQKTIVPYDEAASPENEPLYVNHFQVSHHQSDVFVDVGIIPIDDILKATVGPPKEEVTPARFLVLSRLVMSVSSLVGLRNQINQILEKVEESGFHGEATFSTKVDEQGASSPSIPEKGRGKK